jgi:hypothetical protein
MEAYYRGMAQLIVLRTQQAERGKNDSQKTVSSKNI